MTSIERIISDAEALIASISFDENGEIIGNRMVGGNGGLLSRTTHARADALRRSITAWKKEQEL